MLCYLYIIKININIYKIKEIIVIFFKKIVKVKENNYNLFFKEFGDI